MSMDYDDCAVCGHTICLGNDDYAAYCECGNNFCSVKCGKVENYHLWKDGDDEDQRYDEWQNGSYRDDLSKEVSCVICRNEKYTEYTLFQAVLKHFDITREQAIEIWRSQKDGN